MILAGKLSISSLPIPLVAMVKIFLHSYPGKTHPKETQSFAVTMYDKDAPTGSGFWHWLIFNIPANIMELKSNAGDITKAIAPAGSVQSNTDVGKPGYFGACPPPGQSHQYLITVFALKSKLELDKNATPAVVGFYLNQNAIAKASIVTYGQR